jgi:acetylornithine deacetylase/succinyl-diaminopimelate desuccinylase-like protein
VLPEDSPQYVLDTLNKVVADDQVHISAKELRSGGVPSPMRPDIMNAVKAANADEFPGVALLPIMVVGATDGRYLRSAGIPCYGVQGFFFAPDDIRFHGRDERMPIKSFYEGQAFLYDLVKRLSTP